MRVDARRVDWRFRSPFRIAYEVREFAETVVVELTDGGVLGRGEALGVSYHDETADSVLEQVSAVKDDLVNGVTRADLQTLLPPGGARNAIDCALWDLEAKHAGVRAWALAGVKQVKSLVTAYTLSMDEPDAMARAATAVPSCSVLKLELSGEHDLDRVLAVRNARPEAAIIVDANQSWAESQLEELTRELAELGVSLIEQPLPVGNDAALASFRSPVPLCADEGCQTADSLPSLIGKYQYVNIKLDKTGGLTEALRLAAAAKASNFELMMGCMGGSSLSMAPAFIVGQLCSVIDLDGPSLAVSDVPHAMRHDGDRLFPPETSLWGWHPF